MGSQRLSLVPWRYAAPLVAAACLIISAQAFGQPSEYEKAVLADGPIGYWRLNEPAAQPIAKNNGTLGSAADGEYIGDPIHDFDGPPLDQFPGLGANNRAIFMDDGIDISGVEVALPILDDLQAFTLEGWINPLQHELSSRTGLFGQDNAIEFGFIGSSDIHYWAELPGGGDIHINSFYDFPNEEWHHIAVTSDGATGDVFFYVDGEEQELQQNNSQPLEDLGKDSFGVSGMPFRIGGGDGGVFGGEVVQFVGGMDEVAAYDKFLTQEQIRAHFEAAKKKPGGLPGDFDNDGDRDINDVNSLITNIAVGPANPGKFDLTGDGQVTQADLTFWAKDPTAKETWIGDATLDGEFNTGDLVQVFQRGKFEQNVAAGWDDGDWTGDARFGTGDLVAAFQDGGFEKGPTPGGVNVPEPASGLLAAVGSLVLLAARRRKSSR